MKERGTVMQEYGYTAQVYIFGAQSRAKTLKGYLQFVYPQINIVSFLVDDMEGNEAEIDSIPVQLFNSVKDINCSFDILIATKGIYHDKIKKQLEEKKYEANYPSNSRGRQFFPQCICQKIL